MNTTAADPPKRPEISFRARTQDAYQLKVLAELLTNNLRVGHFELDEKGITLRQVTLGDHALIDLRLNAKRFAGYKFTHDDKAFLGLNLDHFHRMLRSIKKKDSLELFIDDNSPTDLCIKTKTTKEQSRTTLSTIKIQNSQNLTVEIPTGYGNPIIVSSSEIQKSFKDMLNISTTIVVTAYNYRISFSCNADGLLKRTVEFGEADDDEDEEDAGRVLYCQDFATDQLGRITKIAGLSNTMMIYAPPEPDLPLLFESDIGTLGTISIYIKSKQQIAEESEVYDSEDE